MFSSVGYERTTIRDIAAKCGVSTGAVFASFSGKSDLFAALVLEDRMAAYEVVGETLRERLEGPDAKTEDVLLAMFESGYLSRAANVRFVQVAVSAAWSTQLGADMRKLLAQWPITHHIPGSLRRAGSRDGRARSALPRSRID